MKPKLVVGLMSGTSLDGIDAVLVRMRGSGGATRATFVAHHAKRFPATVRKLLLKNSEPSTSRVDEIARLNMLLAHFYADAVRAVARKGGVRLRDIQLIGSHGQTIQHLPGPRRMNGHTIRTTLQLGDPSALATLTGITTVGDFRVADMAAGGEGAPLIPYFDWLMFRSPTKTRILLNIGGIANITALPKGCVVRDVRAFDTGPGNMVIDALMQRFYGKPYDRNGAVAQRGMVALDLLAWMKKHPFLKRTPPKSTGREEFGEEFIQRFLQQARRHDKADIIATATQFTAFSVHDACRRFLKRARSSDELIVSGGGTRNLTLMRALQQLFTPAAIRTIDEIGVPSEAKEAMCFAVLAHCTIAGISTNIPAVTGASRPVVLGKICPGGA